MKRYLLLLLVAVPAAHADTVPMESFQDCLDGARSGVAAERAALACTTVLDSRSIQPERVADFVAARADNFVRLGKFEDALADYDRALARRTSDESLYRRRCHARAIWGRELFAALTDCDTALQMAGDDRKALADRALVHFRRADYPAARADEDAVLAKTPADARSLYLRGLTRLKTGDKAGGDADVVAATAVDTKIADTYAGYGVTP
jgi:tetratricopeptide (TPR) repeat protein